jgi:hypothetical protein
LAKAVFALTSLDKQSIQEFAPSLIDHLDLEQEISQILIFLTIRSLHSTTNGIMPLADRLQLDPLLTNSFVAMSINDHNLRLNAIAALCEKLGLSTPDVVN